LPEAKKQRNVLARSASTFGQQASGYDARVGLPESVGTAVASEIMDCAGLQTNDLVLELGVGTGEIGAHLVRLPVCYLGIDNSAEMHQLFRDKLGERPASLLLADASQVWPLDDSAASVIFASRVIHLLDAEHVARETLRVCRPSGWLMLGRVLREPDSIKERLRRQRQTLLVEAGITPRQGEEGTRRVVERCLAAGAESMGRREVAEWTGETTPAQIISGWETLSRMGSISVNPVTRTAILNELRLWGRAAFGDLDRAEAFRERYAIDGIHLP
jgi:ubiquinone/menaquinone biosynthesis C-methylase UbiE